MMNLPRMVEAEQRIAGHRLDDHVSAIRRELSSKIRGRVKTGSRIAITAGSRGIAHYPEVLATVVDEVRKAGGEPFLIPAMGSHGGATPHGQVEALRSLGIRRVSVVTPYTEDINLLERRFLETHGFMVEDIQGLGLADNLEIAAVGPERVMELVGEVAGDSDGVFISCTNLHVVPLISGLEARLGRPLVASNQASMWAVLRVLRHRGVDGYGKLLEVL